MSDVNGNSRASPYLEPNGESYEGNSFENQQYMNRYSANISLATYDEDQRAFGEPGFGGQNNQQEYDEYYQPNGTHLNDANLDDIKYEEKKRSCFRITKKRVFIFIFIIISLLGITALSGFLLWPRIPNVEYSHVVAGTTDIRAGNTTIQESAQQGSVDPSGVVTFPMVIHLNMDSENYIPWKFDNITVEGYMAYGNNQKISVGSGGLPEKYKLPPRSVGNDLAIVFMFRFDTSQPDYEIAAQSFQESCTVGGPLIQFGYVAKVFMKPLTWVGFEPEISDKISFPCPIEQIQAYGIDVSNITGIRA